MVWFEVWGIILQPNFLQVIMTLVEKDGGKVYPYQFECTPFFFFHTINAFERHNDTIVVDIMAYKNADVSCIF